MEKRKELLHAFLLGILLTYTGFAQENAKEPGDQKTDEAEIQDTWTGVDRIVAVGGIHGNYKNFLKILRSAGLIDQSANWSGGETHLVQTGDVLDRGADSRKVVDLLMKLEEQARAAGGQVHALIGNHEAMNLYGDLRYISPGEFKAFRDGNSKMVRRWFYQVAVTQWQKERGESQGAPLEDSLGTMAKRKQMAFKKEWESQHPLGYFEHRFAFGPNGKYGNWIFRHNSAVRINDTLFMHGGVSPKYASRSIDEINQTIRDELKDSANEEKLEAGMAADRQGPLWYRGLARGEESSLKKHVATLLERHQVKRIVEGHTHMPGVIVPRFDGRVLAIDAGIPKGRLAYLLIESGKAYAVHRSRKVEIPADSGEELLRYLEQTSRVLNRVPSRLQETIEELEESLVPNSSQR